MRPVMYPARYIMSLNQEFFVTKYVSHDSMSLNNEKLSLILLNSVSRVKKAHSPFSPKRSHPPPAVSPSPVLHL